MCVILFVSTFSDNLDAVWGKAAASNTAQEDSSKKNKKTSLFLQLDGWTVNQSVRQLRLEHSKAAAIITGFMQRDHNNMKVHTQCIIHYTSQSAEQRLQEIRELIAIIIWP